MALLEVNNLCRSFGGLRAVNNVSFRVNTGTIKAVIGPNGAGKTTLFNLIAGALKPDGGSILFNGRSIYGLPPFRVAAAGISRTFQNIKLFGNMTVAENIMVGRHTRSGSGFAASMLSLPRTRREEREIAERAAELARLFGIEDVLDAGAASLDFGRQRAVEFARALASEPQLLLLDEPAAGLNIYETNELAKRIVRIRDMGITILLIEHDMSLVMDISDEIAVLSYGEKIAEGPPCNVRNNPQVIAVYLGGDVAQD
ncbi:MAG: ABC transporter ATP-binding protein [Spirochaetes bacterium]|nr:ABC transporter ATP-binding protein [Spirochaetota bacterium]